MEELELKDYKKVERSGFISGILVSIITVCLVILIFTGWVKLNHYHLIIYQSKASSTTQSNQNAKSETDESGNEEKTLTVSDIDLSKVVSKLEALNTIVAGNYFFDYDIDTMVENLYKGYVAGLGDVYTTYYTKDEYQSLTESTSGIYKGIGIKIGQNSQTKAIIISEVFDDTPAKEAGLLAEDEIKAVNGKEVSSFENTSAMVNELRGNDAKQTKLTIYRESTKETLEFTLQIKEIEDNTVKYEILTGNIGYLKITKFEEVTTEQFKTAMKELKKQGMISLIIDLRDNPGGKLTTVIDIANELLPKGVIVSVEDKDGNKEEYTSSGDADFNFPLAVLINENSASASEILAGAIKDNKVGTLMGTTTYGKGIVQNIIPLGDGTAMKLTIAKYYTPSGEYIHGKGISPDIEITASEDTQEDNVLAKAIETLKK